MNTGEVIAAISLLIVLLGGGFAIGARWTKNQNKQDKSVQELSEHKKHCAKEFERIYSRIDSINTERFGQKRDSGMILSELTKILEREQKRQRPRRSATESDDGI